MFRGGSRDGRDGKMKDGMEEGRGGLGGVV
jgi:hypothetical protein